MKSVTKFAVLLLSTTAALPAWAQADDVAPDAAEMEAIVVTGMRQSLMTSVARKRNTTEIVESITAEDIGKLPDPNVAETLTRIPGVQGYRYGGEGASPVGEGSGITIRGLSGQTASHLDGRAYFTAGGREFNIESAIPGMIAGLDVYKNPSAEHIEGGIGGLINVRTRKPLDFGGLTFSAAASMRYNDLAKKTSPEVFGLFADRWQAGDGEMGFMIAANYQESDNRSDSNPAVRGGAIRRAIRADDPGYLTAGGNAAYAGRADIWHLADADYRNFSEAQRADLIAATGTGAHVFQEDIHRVRKGANAAFQWKPNPNLEFYAQGNYNYYLYDQSYRFAILGDSRTLQNLVTSDYNFDEGFLDRNANGGANELVAGRRIDSATFLDSNIPVTLGGREERPYETWLAAVGTNWQATDKLHVGLDISYIRATQSRLNHNVTLEPDADAAGRWAFSRDLTTTPYSIGISGPDLADPSNFVFGSYNTDANDKLKDDGWAGQLDLKYDLDSPFLTAIKAGARFAVQRARYHNFRDQGRPLGRIPVTDLQDLVETAPTNWLDGKAGYPGGYLVFRPDQHFGDNVRDSFPDAGIPAADSMPEQLGDRRYSRESTYAGYLMGEFAHDDLIKGNVGVRVVKTDLLARGMGRLEDGSFFENEQTNSYTDILPSFNITGYITPETMLRFGYAKAITRASLGELNPRVSITSSLGTGTGGNPDLDPLRADSFDLALEHYFSPLSYVSAGVFYKKIKGFLFDRTQCVTIPSAPTPDTTPCADPTQYEIGIRDNAGNGSVKGIELAGQTFFDFLPGPLEHFGVAGSFTYLKAKNPIPLGDEITYTPLPFQSKYSWSASGMYEDDFMSARVVYTYRSDFVLFGIIPGSPAVGRYVKGYGILDAAVNFNLPHNFTLSFTASNITNQGPNRYVGEPGAYASDFQNQYYTNGRVFGVGLRYKFGG